MAEQNQRRRDLPMSELVRLAVEAAPPVTPEQKARIRDLMPPVPADRWSCPNDPEPPPVT